MREPRVWPNVERLVVGWLTQHTGLPVFTETDVDAPLPYLRVERVGGAGDDAEKRIAVEVEVHTATRAAMWDIARDVESAMAALVANGTENGYVDDVEDTFAFAADPPPNRAARRAVATFTLVVRPS